MAAVAVGTTHSVLASRSPVFNAAKLGNKMIHMSLRMGSSSALRSKFSSASSQFMSEVSSPKVSNTRQAGTTTRIFSSSQVVASADGPSFGLPIDLRGMTPIRVPHHHSTDDHFCRIKMYLKSGQVLSMHLAVAILYSWYSVVDGHASTDQLTMWELVWDVNRHLILSNPSNPELTSLFSNSLIEVWSWSVIDFNYRCSRATDSHATIISTPSESADGISGTDHECIWASPFSTLSYFCLLP